MFKFEYQLCLVLCLLFYVQNQNQELGLTMCWEFVRAWSRWYNQGLKDHFFSFCEVSAARSSETTGRKNISSSGWQSENALVFTWLGSYCSLRDVEKHERQGLRALSLPSIMLPTETGHRHPRDSLYWMQMSPKEQVYPVKLPPPHQLLMKSGGEWGEEGHMFRHIVEIISQTSLGLKESMMKIACVQNQTRQLGQPSPTPLNPISAKYRY